MKHFEPVFRADLEKIPRHGRSLFGLMKSLKAQGKNESAKLVEPQYQEAWKNADTKLTLDRAVAMPPIARSEFLKFSAATAAMLALPYSARTASQTRFTSCFYQFSAEAIEALCKPTVLPTAPGFLHIFTESSPTSEKRLERFKLLKSKRPNYKYSFCLDAKHYEGWQTSSDDKLKDLAKRYRQKALDPSAPSDYFAFNEMGFFGHRRPEIRNQLARWMRHVHDPHDGGPALPGVFYLTEGNLKPDLWQGDSGDFWKALDETCELIVGEHFHNYAEVTDQGEQKYGQFLGTFPKWLDESGKPAQVNIAKSKYAILHSSFYAPLDSKWQGVRSDERSPDDLANYFDLIFSANRTCPYTANRICFGPLNNKDLDPALYRTIASAFSKAVALQSAR